MKFAFYVYFLEHNIYLLLERFWAQATYSVSWDSLFIPNHGVYYISTYCKWWCSGTWKLGLLTISLLTISRTLLPGSISLSNKSWYVEPSICASIGSISSFFRSRRWRIFLRVSSIFLSFSYKWQSKDTRNLGHLYMIDCFMFLTSNGFLSIPR